MSPPSIALRVHCKGQDIIEFHYRISGGIEIAGSWGECRLLEPAWLLWFQPNGCDDASERLGAARLGRETWVSLYCDRQWLDQVNAGAATRLDECAVRGRGGRSSRPRFRTGPHIGATIPLLRDIVRANATIRCTGCMRAPRQTNSCTSR